MLRLVGLIAFLILAVVLLVLSCAAAPPTASTTRYEGYLDDVRGIAARSAQTARS